MSATLSCTALVLALGPVLWGQAPASEAVRQAELAFAKQGSEQGIRKAFLAWLTPDAKVFTPQARTALSVYGPEPGDQGWLQWYPEANGVAASGDLAWSMGPWAYAVKRGDAPIVHGHFLSMWQKQPDGVWRVLADIGVPHTAPEAPLPAMAPVKALPTAPPVVSPDRARDSLRQAEARLAAAWFTSGGVALKPFLSREAQVYRPRHLPLSAGEELEKLLASELPSAIGQPEVVQVAASGDLGWTCGETSEKAQGRRASFLRVWVREAGAWVVRFEVRLPHPPPTK